MKILILVSVLFLNGCIYQSVTTEKYKQAELMCQHIGSEIYSITGYFDGVVTVQCTNGSSAFVPKDINWVQY